MRNYDCLFALFLAVMPASAFAWGDSGCAWPCKIGGGGGDGTPLPAEIQKDGTALRDQFFETDIEILLDQQILGVLCSNHECGGVSEEQASRLLDRSIAASLERKQWWSELWSWLIAASGLAVAVGGLWISILSFRQSNKNEREIGQLQGQIVTPEGRKL